MMLRAGLIASRRVWLHLSKKHSGCNVDDSVRTGARDRQGRENIIRHLIRAPFSTDKIQFSRRKGLVLFESKMVKGSNRNVQVYDPLICSECFGPMRIVSFIEEEDAIHMVLERLKF